MKTEGKAKNLIHSVVVDHYVYGRSLRFSNCYYYHLWFWWSWRVEIDAYRDACRDGRPEWGRNKGRLRLF
jgi:hypothetical protein